MNICYIKGYFKESSLYLTSPKSGGDMSPDNREKPAVKTTIVGGRPPGSGTEVDAVPRGVEILLKKAAIDESFRKTLLSDRVNAADAIGLTLNPVEKAMLKAIPESSLERMVAATKVQPKIRQAFMGYTAAVMLAALTAASDGMPQDTAQASRGIQPDTVQGGGPTTADIVEGQSWEEAYAAKLKAESYMQIAPPDENAPRGNLEVFIETFPGGLSASPFMKVHITKSESPKHPGNNRTEGLGYAQRGYFLQKDLPVGEYLVEIGFIDGPLVLSDRIIVKEKKTVWALLNSDKARIIRENKDKPSIILAGSIVHFSRPEEMLAARYNAESYMRVAPGDEKALRGNLEVTIDKWQKGLYPVVFLKIHLLKIKSPESAEKDRTEGVGFAQGGYYLQEQLPVGGYIVDIGFGDKPLVKNKKITIKHNRTAKINVKLASPNKNVSPGTPATLYE
jgi:hypothetical protein